LQIAPKFVQGDLNTAQRRGNDVMGNFIRCDENPKLFDRETHDDARMQRTCRKVDQT
jgi:hypothetical protein